MSHVGNSFRGPLCRLGALGAGLLIGAILSQAVPAPGGASVGLWLVAPFVLMLASIATMPFIHGRVWEEHYPDFAFGLGGVVAGYYLLALGSSGQAALGHAGLEYFQFMALVGSLYVVCGGIFVNVTGRGRPLVNTLLLASGAVLANVVGTTGASMLLIRPFLRINHGRAHAFHVAMFIMIISNCGGCLTPIGDPPLFLGYLTGVPFLWTLQNLVGPWLFVNGALLAIFFFMDRRTKAVAQVPDAERMRISISGTSSLIILPLIIAAVLLDARVREALHWEHVPVGALLHVALAVAAYRLADRTILARNEFNLKPIREVGFLFSGIFATMVPALAYLQANAAELGLQAPLQFYFMSGSLSSVLDNAPTYLSFLQAAFGLAGLPMESSHMQRFITESFTLKSGYVLEGARTLAAISLGSVFFGGMTYIGNGPNFMVKAIAEATGAKAPSFFGYFALALLVLLPVLVAAGLIFLR